MTTARARGSKGRPTKEQNAQMELVALRGAITRFIVRAGPDIRRLSLLASYDVHGRQAEAGLRAEVLRLLRAKDASTAL